MSAVHSRSNLNNDPKQKESDSLVLIDLPSFVVPLFSQVGYRERSLHVHMYTMGCCNGQVDELNRRILIKE